MMWRMIVATIIDASNTIVPEALTILLQSTVIGALGVSGYHLVRSRGPIVQSVVLRLCLVALIAVPVVHMVTLTTRVNITIPRAVLPRRVSTESFHAEVPNIESLRPSEDSPPAELNPLIPSREIVSTVPNEAAHPVSSMSGRNPTERQKKQERGGYPHLLAAVQNPPVSEPRESGSLKEIRESGRGITGIIAACVYTAVTLVWIAMSLYFIIRWFIAIIYLVHIRRESIPARRKYDHRCRRIAADMGVIPPHVLISQKVQSVFLVGTVNPAIVLPDRRQTDHLGSREIFIHELTHLKRHDNIWKAIIQLVIVLYPLQPLVWIINRYLDVTSDFICDDMVVRLSGTGTHYAAQLHDIAVTMTTMNNPVLLSGAGILSIRSPFLMRIERILETTSVRRVSARMHEVCWIMTLFMCSLVFTGFIGFKGEVERINSTGTVVVTQPDNLQAFIERALGRVSVAAAFPEHYISQEREEIEPADAVPNETPAMRTDDNESATVKLVNVINASAQAIRHEQVEEPVENDLEPGKRNAMATDSDTIPVVEHSQFMEIPGMDSMTQPIFDTAASEPDILPVSTAFTEITTPVPTVEQPPLQMSNSGMGIASTRGISRIHIPTGTQLQVEVEDYDVNQLDLNDPEEKKLYDVYRSLEMNQNEPAWSPDGSKIAFTDNSRIWIVSADGGEPEKVYENFDITTGFSVGGIKSLCFSPDGTELTFQKNVYDESRGSKIKRYSDTMVVFSKPVVNVETVNIETGDHRIMFGEAEGCVWSPGGRYCFFLTWNQLPDDVAGIWPEHGRPMLYDAMLDETREIDTGLDNLICGRATFSPDESALVIPVRQGAGPVNLISIAIENGKQRWLTDNAGEAYTFQYLDYPQYSPDGKWLLYTDFSCTADNANKQLMLLSVTTGETFRLLEGKGTSTAYGKWSPDGTHIAYLSEQYDASYIYLYTFYPANYVLGKPAFEGSIDAPQSFGLTGNYPNPFNPSTTILFNLPEDGMVEIVIYNTNGQKVRRLVNEYRNAGEHAIVWDGTDEYGQKVSSGIYLTRMNMSGRTSSHKMTLQK